MKIMRRTIKFYNKKMTKRFWSWLLTLHGEPHAIAGGFALGLALAFTPTVGIQMLLAVVIATPLNLNRAASIVPLWISNPLTIVPIYAFSYWIGSFFINGPSYPEVVEKLRMLTLSLEELDPLALHEHFSAVLGLGLNVFLAMTLGGLIVGIPLGILSYYLLLPVLEKRQKNRKSKVPTEP
jgi:uncharacterized protein (DUF2062 family)